MLWLSPAMAPVAATGFSNAWPWERRRSGSQFMHRSKRHSDSVTLWLWKTTWFWKPL